MHEFRKFSDIITRSKFCTQPKSKEANRFGIRFITQSLTPRGTSFRPGKHSEYQFNYSLREFPRFFISHPIFSKERVVLRDACVSRFDSSIDRDQEINDIGDRPRGNYIFELQIWQSFKFFGVRAIWKIVRFFENFNVKKVIDISIFL